MAPLFAPLVFAVSGAIKDHSWEEVSGFVFLSVVGLPIYGLAACIGFAIWLILRKYKIESLPVFAIGGGVIGFAVSELFRIPLTLRDRVTFTLAGLIPSFVFWLFLNAGRSRAADTGELKS